MTVQAHLTAAKAPFDQGASWGGLTVAMIALALFLGFAAWIIVQRIKHGPRDHGGDDD